MESLIQLLDLHNKVTTVTGAGMGIGRSIALRLAEAGASVLITDSNLEAVQQTVVQIARDIDIYDTRLCF